MYYAIKNALEISTDSNRNIYQEVFLDELFKAYQSRRTLNFIWELLETTFKWAKDFATIESDLEKFKERVIAELYCMLSDIL
jgi:hypothetical protein